MLVFPQLGSGASALYPVTKNSIQRTAVNTLSDGSTIVFADPDAAVTAWELHASGLTAAEWNAIEALFQATSGSWQRFTFLDPAGNLLLQSENFGATAWTNGPLLALTTGVADPLGTTRATHLVNAGGTAEALTQPLNVPGDYMFCLSVWARTDAGSRIYLMQSTTGASIGQTFPLTTQWQRISFAGNCEQATTQVTFAAQLDAGASVDLFGMQVEAQLAASDYRQTVSRSGVFAKARFTNDQFTVTAQGTDVYDVVIEIIATED
jgi:hypothetical protein